MCLCVRMHSVCVYVCACACFPSFLACLPSHSYLHHYRTPASLETSLQLPPLLLSSLSHPLSLEPVSPQPVSTWIFHIKPAEEMSCLAFLTPFNHLAVCPNSLQRGHSFTFPAPCRSLKLGIEMFLERPVCSPNHLTADPTALCLFLWPQALWTTPFEVSFAVCWDSVLHHVFLL